MYMVISVINTLSVPYVTLNHRTISIPVCSDLDLDLGLRITASNHIMSSDELLDLLPLHKKSSNNIPSDSSGAQPTTTGGDTESGHTSFVFRPTTPPKKIFVDSSSSPTVKQEDYHPDL